MNSKIKGKAKDAMFQKELEIADKAGEICNKTAVPAEELREEYSFLSGQYRKSLSEMIKITRVGDMNYNKLMVANEKIQEQKNELEILNRQLRDINMAKDRFNSIIAHDLRNPLQFLLFSADVMENTYGKLGDEKVRDFSEKVYLTAKRMSELLENLLHWSRSQYGDIECHPRPIDLYLLAQDNMEYHSGSAEKKQINLILQITKDTFVYADENMIKLVFRNLIGNAIKFTPGGGSVTVSAKKTGSIVAASVSDTGTGIDVEDLDSLFRFGSGCISRGTEGEKGSGLGLVLCREFVEKNGGEIKTKSKVDEGTIFEFTLPSPPAGQNY
ncbi:MAG: HAMP domain-containing histidine kinase [Candidatus Aminicenantes bacterium]|nr:HAMP domain-containing histidine kinase [Candidatus Aminicenantes bacterium]